MRAQSRKGTPDLAHGGAGAAGVYIVTLAATDPHFSAKKSALTIAPGQRAHIGPDGDNARPSTWAFDADGSGAEAGQTSSNPPASCERARLVV